MSTPLVAADVAGFAACPRCGGHATREPGGLRCLICGACWLYRWVLPRNHWLSGTDRANRERQRTLDRSFMSPGRQEELLIDMLDRLRPRSRAGTPA